MNITNFKSLGATNDIIPRSVRKVFGAWSDSIYDINTTGESIIETFYTSSTEVADWDGNYFYNIYQEDVDTLLNAPSQFSIAFATTNSIELNNSDEQLKYTYPSYAVYRQFVNTLIGSTSDTLLYFTSASVTRPIEDAYIISVNRDRLRDGLEPTTWQLNLSGSSGKFTFVGGPVASATNYVEILSGSYADTINAVPSYENELHSYGRLYYERGIFVFNSRKLHETVGLTPYTPAQSYASPLDPYKGLNTFYETIKRAKMFKLRSLETVQSTYYFVRVLNSEFNRSPNPTWTTGSGVTKDEFYYNPKVYITTVGLYDANSVEPVAIAKLSNPILKTPETELSIRIKLDW